MKSLVAAIVAAVVLAHAISIVAAVSDNGKRKRKIGLVTAGLPWLFGPYQAQMHHLSLLLSESNDDDEIEYDIYWYNYADPSIPKGIYKSYDEIKDHLPTTNAPPEEFPMDHLTFLGKTLQDGQLSANKFNELTDEYGLDCLVTLMDITKVIPNVAFKVPVVAWTPLHSERVSSATIDYWVLRRYHGIASLAPSSAKAIRDAVGKEIELSAKNSPTTKALKETSGSVEVDFIPHTFDQKAIMASADVGLQFLKEHSVAEADAKLTKSPLVNRGQESTLEPFQPTSLFGEARKDDFIVLLQGGNYETEDRKGWDTSLQAFVRFYNSMDDPSRVHLLIHSMESYLVAADVHSDIDAPFNIMPKGVQLHFLLHEHGLPRDAYTVDIARHAPEVVAAYKKRADVCLHPSKVEGFGMNVMECQVVGTPVITTKYMAMDDFTKVGRSVSHRQMIRNPGFIYDMAVPDVIGVSDALRELYTEHLAMKQGDEKAVARRKEEILGFNLWLDKTCSPEVVGNKFKQLLVRAFSEFGVRKTAEQQLSSISPPESGAYEIVSGYHSTIVDWDAPWALFAPEGLKITNPANLHRKAWMAVMQEGDTTPMVMVLPATYEDGKRVPFQNQDGTIHDDLPILIRSYMVTAFQDRMSRRKSIVMSAIQSSPSQPFIMREGMAIIERKKRPGGSQRQTQHVEL